MTAVRCFHHHLVLFLGHRFFEKIYLPYCDQLVCSKQMDAQGLFGRQIVTDHLQSLPNSTRCIKRWYLSFKYSKVNPGLKYRYVNASIRTVSTADDLAIEYTWGCTTNKKSTKCHIKIHSVLPWRWVWKQVFLPLFQGEYGISLSLFLSREFGFRLVLCRKLWLPFSSGLQLTKLQQIICLWCLLNINMYQKKEICITFILHHTSLPKTISNTNMYQKLEICITFILNHNILPKTI